MSKKTKDNTIDLFYINDKEEKKKSKKKKKNNNVPKKTERKKDIIDLDNEIIIGLTPKPVQKNTKKPKTSKNKPLTKKGQANTSKKYKSSNSNNEKKVDKKNTIKIKILKCLSVVILLMVAVILFMLSPIFNVKDIVVEGTEKLVQEEIISLSQINIDENTFKINKKQVIKRIQENTYVETVNINRELPSTVKIKIKERTPQYIIQIANGNVYIDSKGYILEISTEMLQLPILNGYETSIESIIDFKNTKKLSDSDCAKIEVVNQIIESATNNEILQYITAIDISNIENITLNLDGEKKVAYLGDGSNANLRILYLKKMINEEAGKEGEAFINGDLHTLKPKPYFREKV